MILCMLFFSCNSPLSNSYKPINFDEDLNELKDVISIEELNELVDYIALSSALGVDLSEKTYFDLLNEVKESKTLERVKINTFLIDNVQDMIDERLEKDECNNLASEINAKNHNGHNEKRNINEEWGEEDFFFDY